MSNREYYTSLTMTRLTEVKLLLHKNEIPQYTPTFTQLFMALLNAFHAWTISFCNNFRPLSDCDKALTNLNGATKPHLDSSC